MNFFRDTSIGNKILIPPLIMMVALGAVLLLAVRGFNNQTAILNEVQDIALERTTLVDEFMLLSESVESDLYLIAVLRFMNLPEKEVQPIHERLEQGLSDMKTIYGHIITKWPLDQGEKEILEKMRIPMDAFYRQAWQATDVVSKDPSFGIVMVRSAHVPFDNFRSLLATFLDYQKKKIRHAKAISKQEAETVKTTTEAIAIFTTLIAVLISAWISSRLISRPVRSMTMIMGGLAAGDLSLEVGDTHRKDEIGSMARAVEVFRKNAIEKQAMEEERERLIGQLQKALDEVKTLKGFLPICASCKKIRDDQGYWNQIESYIRDHSEAEFTHSICPECAKKLYPDFYADGRLES